MNDTITPDINDWTSRTGQHRRYINNWTDIVGLDVELYGTGNIRWATLDGREISNSRAGAIRSAKVWLDDADTIHVDYLPSKAEREITADEIAARVRKAL
jgi:translation initiation factor IF-1